MSEREDKQEKGGSFDRWNLWGTWIHSTASTAVSSLAEAGKEASAALKEESKYFAEQSKKFGESISNGELLESIKATATATSVKIVEEWNKTGEKSTVEECEKLI